MLQASDRDASLRKSSGNVPTGRRPRGRPGASWRGCISHLAWERRGIPQEELECVAGSRDVCTTLLSLLPLPPDPGLVEKGFSGHLETT